MHQLQPATLPEYYKPPVDVSVGTYPKPPEMEQPKPLTQYREFAKSTTYKSVKLPLKKPRLASPFPDPVKVMPSDTVSDQEKAVLKEAECRLPKSSSCGESSSNGPMMQQQRSYSSNASEDDVERKCGKKKKRKGSCPKIKGPCPPTPSKACDRDYPFKKCTKKDAPYPAYSEFCHTIPDEHPSECKICPWRPLEHPTFKSQKKKFHSSAVAFCPRKRGSEKRQLGKDKATGWVDQGKWRKQVKMDPGPPRKVKNFPNTLKSNLSHTVRVIGKKPCERPVNKRCEKERSKKKKNKKSKNKKNKSKVEKSSKTQKKSKTKQPKKKATVPLNTDKSWVTLVDPDSIPALPNISDKPTPYLLSSKKASKGGKKQKGKGSCKKLPYSGCKIKKKEKQDDGKCPQRKKKKIVDDCPEEVCDNKKASSADAPFKNAMLLKKDDKCPTITNEVCKEEEEEDPCAKKRTGTTKNCPKDLLIKKRKKPSKPRPRKQSQEATTPPPS